MYQWQGSDPESDIGKTLQAYNAAVAETDRVSAQSELETPPRQ